MAINTIPNVVKIKQVILGIWKSAIKPNFASTNRRSPSKNSGRWPTSNGDASPKQHSWGRDQISELVHQIRSDRHEEVSLNRSAAQYDVASTTAQNWLRNRSRLEQESGLDPIVVQFFRITPRARVAVRRLEPINVNGFRTIV